MPRATATFPQELTMCTGANARVAVLDSGRNPNFPLLKCTNDSVFDCIMKNGSLQINNIANSENSDRCEHGSIVESLLRSIAPRAAVDHYRILDEHCACNGELLCETLAAVVTRGYHIVNLSLGTQNERLLPKLVNVLKMAYERDVTIVASSSNIGKTVYPASFPYCISTSATNTDDSLHLAFTPRSVVEFAAMGVNVLVDGPNGKLIRVTGSSYATAQVSGLAARAIELLGENASPLDIKILLRNFARSRAA